eukprot:NODE_3472_length_2030_cov_8.044666.p1 GENE.NODE_3472_length_2030_cov_8.044666~~NODE_3472_length_2030_cov_8.044666.p1  ORF type:complete len:596 (+),score=186.72 NODE_3472_length_2030_cov_8.044666:40-1788(+)
MEPILEGRDVLGVAARGAGKTVGYLAPLLDRVAREGWAPGEYVAVLVPTRALAEQVHLTAHRLRATSTRVVLLYGGEGLEAEDAQRVQLRRGAHLVIGTPRHVQKMTEEGLLPASQVRVLVVDEAVDMFSRTVRALLFGPGVPASRQTLVFAGTASPGLWKDIAGMLRNPLHVDLLATRPELPSNMRHISCEVPTSMARRARAIAWVLEERLLPLDGDYDDLSEPASSSGGVVSETQPWASKALIFAPTRAEVGLLTSHAMLRRRAIALHGGLTAPQRHEALELFAASDGSVLVATDAAARAVEMPAVPLVLHVLASPNVETYVRRVHQAAVVPRAASESIVVHTGHLAKNLERELGVRFERLEPPDNTALRHAAVVSISRELCSAGTQFDAEAFEDDAAQQLDIHGHRLLAAALVLLERRHRSEEWRSPLSGRARYTPLLLFDPYLEALKSRADAVQAIARALKPGMAASSRAAAARIGRVALTTKGYIADVPNADVPRVLRDAALRRRGVSVVQVTRLPELLDETREGASGRQRRRRPRSRRGRRERPENASQRMQFLYPAGRRVPFGKFHPAGREQAGT